MVSTVTLVTQQHAVTVTLALANAAFRVGGRLGPQDTFLKCGKMEEDLL